MNSFTQKTLITNNFSLYENKITLENVTSMFNINVKMFHSILSMLPISKNSTASIFNNHMTFLGVGAESLCLDSQSLATR